MKEKEIVQRIKSHYVGEDCIQIMVPYKNALTILDRNGIVYHHKKGSDFYINNYLEDERRKQFPYHNIPTHWAKVPFYGKLHYANQLFDFEQPYIRIGDGIIIESYVVKDKNEALKINKVMPVFKRTGYRTRKELDKMFEQPSNKNEKLYILYRDGSTALNNELKIRSEKEILEYIEKRDLKDYEFNLPLNKIDTILLVKTDGINIQLQGVDIYFRTADYYKVDTFDIPVTKYTLEQLKWFTSKIVETKEPKMPLRLNPSISKEDVKQAKQLILEKRK